ncbi:Formyltransferase [Hymenopellis radicata]|nr:Formyltransferase [Hymenopellis radicata]
MSKRVVVLISGSGTNLQALIDANLPNVSICLVLSNRKAAYGLTRAQQATPPIPTAYLALQSYLKSHPEKTRTDYDAEVAKIVVAQKPDLVVLAGWMHVLSEGFLDLTIAEGIPFDGSHAIARAFEAWKKKEITRSGAMVHKVVKEVDRGEPLIVREIPFEENDTLETYEERLHGVEWEILVEAVIKVLK